MVKKYRVKLTIEEQEYLKEIIKKQEGSSEKIKRAQILLKTDESIKGWTDEKIAEAFYCTKKTVENVRTKYAKGGIEEALNRKKRETPPVAKKIDGEQEAKIIAIRLGEPPEGFSKWSLRLLKNRVIELGIIETVSIETIRTTLKKTE